MTTSHKRFDTHLHNHYDPLGREAVKRYQHHCRGREAIDNDDPYGVDLLIMTHNQLLSYCEVEVRTCWNNDTFPFPTVHVAHRKTKLLTNDKPTWFVVVNTKQTHMLVCDAHTVLSAPLHEIPNRYVASNEYFYDVPLNQMRLMQVPPPDADNLF